MKVSQRNAGGIAIPEKERSPEERKAKENPQRSVLVKCTARRRFETFS